MRLTPEQQRAIREETQTVFGADARVRLFGSRIDDAEKGGDIDLLVESPAPVEAIGVRVATLSVNIQKRLGEQKIDILYCWPGMKMGAAHRVALEQGIVL